MNVTMYLYDEETDDFQEISKIKNDDVVFVVLHDEEKVMVWQGSESPRMKRYKAGMKVTSLISAKQLYGFKHEVLAEGEEPSALKAFLNDQFAKRTFSHEDLAKEDRQHVQEMVKDVSQKFSETPQAAEETSTKAPPEPKPEPSHESKEEEETAPEMPETELEGDLARKEADEESNIQDEIKKMTGKLGSDMVNTDETLGHAAEISKEKQEIIDEMKKEEIRQENAENVEQTKIQDEMKQVELKVQEEQRVKTLEEEKRKVEALERQRIAEEKLFMEEKLKKEKEEMEQERKALEEKIKQEDQERKKQYDTLEKIRKEKENEVVEFELRKLDLKMQVHKKGVDQYEDPGPDAYYLYRVDQGDGKLVDKNVLTSGDVYILDRSSNIYVWEGDYATLDEKYFGEEIGKLLQKKRGEGAKVEILKEGKETIGFLSSFPSLKIIVGDHAKSVLKGEEIVCKGDFITYRIKSEVGLLFKEVPCKHESISKDDSFLFDFGDKIFIWHGKEANPEERGHSEDIAKMFGKERGGITDITVLEDGKEPEFFKIPAELWYVLLGDEKASAMEDAHVRALESAARKEREAKEKKSAEEKKREEDVEKRALDEMERIEREMLEKEIERKKEQLTPQEIEEKWKAFRREMRKRRGLPEEEVFPAPPTGEPAGKPIEEEEKEMTPEEKEKVKQQKLREVDELFRIEKEMLEKKIERDNPGTEEEAKLLAELQEKIEKQKQKIEEEFE